jgi:hypothetical protein
MERAVDLEKAVLNYGGHSALARALNLHLSTVHGWSRRGRLPPWRADAIARMGRADRIDVLKEQPRKPRRRKVK